MCLFILLMVMETSLNIHFSSFLYLGERKVRRHNSGGLLLKGLRQCCLCTCSLEHLAQCPEFSFYHFWSSLLDLIGANLHDQKLQGPEMASMLGWKSNHSSEGNETQHESNCSHSREVSHIVQNCGHRREQHQALACLSAEAQHEPGCGSPQKDDMEPMDTHPPECDVEPVAVNPQDNSMEPMEVDQWQ